MGRPPTFEDNQVIHHMNDIIYIVVSVITGGILILFTWSCSKI